MGGWVKGLVTTPKDNQIIPEVAFNRHALHDLDTSNDPNGNIAVKTFHFDDLGLAQVLTDYTLSIPPHQRDYAWTSEEVEQLFSDIEAAYRASSEYFLGTIVAIDADDGKPLSVVDGQQRLTTTYLLLAAIRDYLHEAKTGQDISTSLQGTYLFTSDRREGFKQRLTLNTDDKEFFKSLTSKNDPENKWPPETTRTSHKLLLDAYRICRSRIEKIAKSVSGVDAPETLNNWIDYLEKSAQVILLRSSDKARAFKMFETLNDRGLRTSQADLVKSYLFGLAESDLTTAQSRWSTLLENLQDIDVDDPQIVYLRHYLIANETFVRADGVYEAIQNRVKSSGKALSLLTSLSKSSKTYVATYNADSEYWDEYSDLSKKYLRDFNLFDLLPMRPLLLSLATSFKPTEFEKSIKLLCSLSVRLILAARTRSGVNEQAFSDAARDVSSGDIKKHTDLIPAISKVFVSNSDFKEIFEKAKVSKTTLARYYLRELEHQRSGRTKGEQEWVNEDPNEITLEHILPKTRPKVGWAEFDDEAHKAYRTRLGNLCLLKRSENNGMDNSSFATKKPVFQDSSLGLTNELANFTSWDPQTIEVRQEKLAELAIQTWPQT